jgi:chemotaxis protein MotB
MRKKKGGHAGGHGWFVTFADLMALLLSFFVMLVAFSTQDRQKLQMVAGSMRDAFGTTRDSYFAGVIEIKGIPVRPRLKNAVEGTPEDAAAETAPSSKDTSEQGRNLIARDQGVALAASSLRQAINEMPELAELSKNIIVEERVNGINVALTDQTGLSMFPEGSTEPFERVREALVKLAPLLLKLSNRIAITGHTATQSYGLSTDAMAWDLSVGRASAVRKIFSEAGILPDRFASVTGKADTEPLFPDNPQLPSNRRIDVFLIKEAPPMPQKQKF